MSEQVRHNPPIAEGIQHGPYPDDGTPYSQANGLQAALHDAYREGRLDFNSDASREMGANVQEMFEQGNKERWDSLSSAEQEAEIAEEEAERQRLEKEDAEHERQLIAAEELSNPDYYNKDEENEDPLEGDVDKFVHSDETRTDEQIAHDEKYRIEPY